MSYVILLIGYGQILSKMYHSGFVSFHLNPVDI